MSFIELFILAVGLSMDAFAAAVCSGLAMKRLTVRKVVLFSLYIGLFHTAMPLAGYYAASLLTDVVAGIDHWIAFVLLGFIGGKMVVGSFRQEGCSDRDCPEGVCTDRDCPGGQRPDTSEPSLGFLQMVPLALAVSIDALAVGASFAFLHVDILAAALLIGLVNFVIVAAGVKIGNVFGTRFKSKAELAGGLTLILIGLKTLIEHLDLF